MTVSVSSVSFLGAAYSDELTACTSSANSFLRSAFPLGVSGISSVFVK
nr:hypothetical protein [Bacillus velezensis]